MALINPNRVLLLGVNCLITLLLISSDVNALQCRTCKGEEPVDLSTCKSEDCAPGQICAKYILKSSVQRSTVAQESGITVRSCSNMNVNRGDCFLVNNGVSSYNYCVCNSTNCNSAKSIQGWNPVIFTIWVGLPFSVASFLV